MKSGWKAKDLPLLMLVQSQKRQKRGGLGGEREREREVWAKLSLALTVRDNTSQQQLSKIRKGLEEGREHR